jgi:N-acetylmuramoyl-L-alanine amidase
MIAVILDGGHGFETPGKRANDDSLRENEFNDSVVNKLSLLLEMNSIPYAIVSSEWRDISLQERVEREKDFYRKFIEKNLNPVLISVHANAADDTRANGYETFIVNNAKETTKTLGEIVHKNVFKAYSKHRKNAKDRGLKEAGFYIIKNSNSPAVLIECGFMTNLEDLEILKKDSYRNDVAKSLYEAIVEMKTKL